MRLYILFLNEVAAKLQRIHKTHLRTKYKRTCIDFNRRVFEIVLLIFTEFYSLFSLNNISFIIKFIFFFIPVELFKHLHFNRFKNIDQRVIKNFQLFVTSLNLKLKSLNKNLFTDLLFHLFFLFFSIFFSVFFDVNLYFHNN